MDRIELLKLWSKTFQDNYNGVSQEAQSLEKYIKENYKGNAYIPWATMERLMYQQDPTAEFFHIKKDDGLVHIETYDVATYSNTNDKLTETKAQAFIHFVAVGLTFIGKYFEEYYPVQDNMYEAPKIINQNMVNKALQRAKAKIISRATGLALKLYEGEDLQFEKQPEKDNVVGNKAVINKIEKQAPMPTTPKAPTTTTTKETNTQAPKSSDENLPIAEYLKENRELLKVGMQKLNTTLIAKYGKESAFDLDKDSVEDILEKLKTVSSPQTFLKAIKTQSGVKDE